MTQINEIAPDIFRISTFIPEINLQFNQFLVRDAQPLLFHTGMKGLFPMVRAAVATLLPPSTIRWIGFSHFEADECGALAEWQTLAPEATAVCSFVGKMVSVDDVVARRPAQAMADGEVLSTGKYRFRMLLTPHVPHCWEASLLYEETQRTLLCSDLFHQNGDLEPSTSSDVVGRFKQTSRRSNRDDPCYVQEKKRSHKQKSQVSYLDLRLSQPMPSICLLAIELLWLDTIYRVNAPQRAHTLLDTHLDDH